MAVRLRGRAGSPESVCLVPFSNSSAHLSMVVPNKLRRVTDIPFNYVCGFVAQSSQSLWSITSLRIPL